MNMIIDETTGEVRDALPDEMSDQALIEAVQAAKTRLKEDAERVASLEGELLTRMNDREATLVETEGFTARLEPSYRHEYDIPALEKLSEHLSREQYGKAVSYVAKVDKRGLNALVKLGGEVKRIIESAVTTITSHRLVIEEKRPSA